MWINSNRAISMYSIVKIRFLVIIGILLATFVFPLGTVEKAYADCNTNVNYENALKESELVFTGTVTRLDNYDGPQKVTFFIHDTIKGEINTPKYILENSKLIFLENNSIRSSSINVDYKIEKTYKVYVQNGGTSRCTTKITTPPTDYVWEPEPLTIEQMLNDKQEPRERHEPTHQKGEYPPPVSDYTFGKVEVSYRNLPDLRASCAFDGQIVMWFYQFIVNPLCEIGIQMIPDYECNCNVWK